MSKAKNVILRGSKKKGYLIKINDPIIGLFSLTTATGEELRALWLLIGKELKK